MPVLKNPKHEIFAQGVAKGMTAVAAYAAAGYKPHLGNPARLLSENDIRSRVFEIQSAVNERAIKAMALTKGDIVAQLVQDRELAYRVEAPGAAIQASMGQAKILGHITDKHMVGIRRIEDMTEDEALALLGEKSGG